MSQKCIKENKTYYDLYFSNPRTLLHKISISGGWVLSCVSSLFNFKLSL